MNYELKKAEGPTDNRQSPLPNKINEQKKLRINRNIYLE